MPGFFKDRRQVGNTVIESQLGAGVGVDEQYFHGSDRFNVPQRLSFKLSLVLVIMNIYPRR